MLAVWTESFALILVRQVPNFAELVAHKTMFLSGRSLHLCETDTDITGDISHGGPRILNYSVFDDFFGLVPSWMNAISP